MRRLACHRASTEIRGQLSGHVVCTGNAFTHGSTWGPYSKLYPACFRDGFSAPCSHSSIFSQKQLEFSTLCYSPKFTFSGKSSGISKASRTTLGLLRAFSAGILPGQPAVPRALKALGDPCILPGRCSTSWDSLWWPSQAATHHLTACPWIFLDHWLLLIAHLNSTRK